MLGIGQDLSRVVKFVGLVVCLALVMSLDVVGTVHASACSECWDGCRQEARSCNTFCAGCPYPGDPYFQSSTGHTINCAGGVAQCMNNCSYAEMLCYDNCNYSSCGFPIEG